MTEQGAMISGKLENTQGNTVNTQMWKIEGETSLSSAGFPKF